VDVPGDIPKSNPAGQAGSSPASQRDGRDIDGLTWREIADAVYLAAIRGGAGSGEGPAAAGVRDRGHADAAAEPGPESRGIGPDVGPGEPPLPGRRNGHPGNRPDTAERPPACGPAAAEPDRRWAGWPARVISWPEASPLPSPLRIVRALRRLKRTVPSRRPDEVVLDADATAEQAAERGGVWFPVTRPQKTRWLDLTLVIDRGPSMTAWRATVTAFIGLLRQSGAFRTIQLRLLDTHRSGSGTGAMAAPVLRGGTPDTPARSPAEILDRSGRRIVLVMTDGVAGPWRNGLVNPMLAGWGSVLPVAVIHLLPQRLWARTGLALRQATLTVPAPLSPNRSWRTELADAWLEPEPRRRLADGAVAVPVLELDARWLGWWATLITGGHRAPADAVVLCASDAPTAGAPDTSAGHVPARERVRRFLTVASPPALRLATLLAALPVSLSVARHVQSELVPESGPDHLAEVLTSGLLQPSGAGDAPWDIATFDIPQAVRAELLSGARRSETARAVRVTAERFGDQLPVLTRIRDAIEDPDGTPDPATADAAGEIELERAVMRSLSGPYRHRGKDPANETHQSDLGCVSLPAEVDQLRHDRPVGDDAGSGPVEREGSNRSVSDFMSDRVELADAPFDRSPGGPGDEPASARRGTSVQDGPGGVSTISALPAVPGLERRLAHAPGIPPVWGKNVPPRNPNFTGRRVLLERLSERLTVGSTTAVLPAALHGMGGIGKTQMAVEYIYRHLQDYDVVWWIHATQVAQIRSGLTELASALGLPGGNEANTAVPAVREALRLGQPYSRWLLVFDAAESPDVVRPFFPANGPGEILVTSRNPDWASVARPLEVNVFQREESIELLRRRGPEIEEADASELADKLGDLPLAIEQAAAWRAETGMPVHEYLRLFDEKVAEILDTTAPADYEVSVAAAWNVSFDELARRNPAAHQLLQVCAFFAPEPISRNLFTGVRGVSVSPELDQALRDPMQLGRAIRDISRYGLAKIDHRTNTLLLHRLVQLVLRNRMPAPVRAVMEHGAHLLLANLDPGQPATSEHWPRYLDVLPHVYAADLVKCDDGWARQLVINLMHFLYHYGDHEEALRLSQRAFETWTEALGEADSQTLAAAERNGFYLWELGRYAEASELNQRTVTLRRQVSGENAEETLYAQISVTADLRARGDFAAAKKLSGEILERARGLFGSDDPMTLGAAHIHAISLRFTGEYRKALELDVDTHRRRVEVLGYEHAHTLNTYTAVLHDRRESGDYAGARAGYEDQAKHLSRLFGNDKAATLRVYSYLAIARRKDGDHASALELSTLMLDRFRTRYGAGHPAGMTAALSHTIDVRQNNDLGRACILGEEAFDRFRALLGENHPHTLAASLDLAVTLRLMGDVAGARQLDERVLEQFRTTLGPDHPYSVIAAINLASDLSALGETEAAYQLGAEGLDRSGRVLGSAHATTLAAGLNLVLDLRTLGRKQEAETRYAEVLTGYRHLLGEAHPATSGAAKSVRANCDIDPLPF